MKGEGWGKGSLFGMKLEVFPSKANQIGQETFRFDCRPWYRLFYFVLHRRKEKQSSFAHADKGAVRTHES